MDLKWKKFLFGNANGISIYTTDEYFEVYEQGNTDPEMIDDMEKEQLDGKIIFDVGAFIGLSSMVFSKKFPKSKIISFEPNKFNRERISKNFSYNKKLSKNIKVFPYALSNNNQIVSMYLSKVIEGPSSTSRIKGSHSTIRDENLPECFEYCDVEAMKLDTFVKNNNLIPDVLKIDIEGAEYFLLLGAVETVNNYHPLIYIELHSEYCALKCTEFLINAGYELTILKEESDNRVIVKAKYINLQNNINLICKYENLVTNLENTLLINNKLISELEESFNKMIEKEMSNIVYINDLKKKIDEYDTINNGLKNENNKLKNEMNILNSYIKNIESSRSWKITKPLRKVSRLIKKEK